jgi:hypothetical protein
LKDNCVPVDDPAKWAEVEAEGKIPLGEVLKIDKPEYMEEVQKMNQQVREARAKGGDR